MITEQMRRCSSIALTLGLALVSLALVLFFFGPTHSVAAATDGRALHAERTNPDEVLRDEALEIRRRVAEFRERSQAPPAGISISRICFLCGAALTILGAVGRLATNRTQGGAPTG